jgi:ABC-type uncharacterized transport system auxiliary subunit
MTERGKTPEMRRIWQAALFCMLAIFVAGCGASRPINYYVLDIGPALASAAPPQFPVTLLVARITSTELYRDDRLVYSYGPVRLGTYEYERWAGPPVAMVRDMLISSLRTSQQYRSVTPIGSNLRGEYVVRGRLYALDEVDKPELAARFSLEIDLYDIKSGAMLWTDSYSHDEPVNGKGVSDVVEAMDRNVRAGLQQLTTNLAGYFASHAANSAAVQ